MYFNIDAYLAELPENIPFIDLNGYGLEYIPSLARFTNLTVLRCSYNKLTSLPQLNENLTCLDCKHNCLTSLPPLPQNLDTLLCNNNKLSSLPDLNQELHELSCEYNQITCLPNLNQNLKILVCSNNQLTSLPQLNENLKQLYCDYNRLKILPQLNANLKILYCKNNRLYSLPNLNTNLTFINYEKNPICGVITGRNINLIRPQIQTLNRVRHLYYCLKFKSRFRHWLWVKIREPKIIAHFHPSYLVENLHDMDKLDELLNNW